MVTQQNVKKGGDNDGVHKSGEKKGSQERYPHEEEEVWQRPEKGLVVVTQ